MSDRVTFESLDRTNADRRFSAPVRQGGFGRLEHERMVMPVAQQTRPHGNRDTLYSSGVFDLEAAPLEITLPDPGRRFMSLVVVDEHSETRVDCHAPGTHTFTRAALGTRYALVEVRIFVAAHDAADVDAVHTLQDAIVVRQRSSGGIELPSCAVGCAGSGAASDRATLAIAVTPAANDGATVHRLTVRDVPVDGLWSIAVYNAAGAFEPNDLDAYTVNSVTAARTIDGSITVQFGGCGPDVPNCLPITPGWSYVVRLYRPRAEVLDGEWQFPHAEPVTAPFTEAVELVRWGMPIVASTAIRHALLHDAGARDHDIVYWSRPADAATQLPTIHGAARYVLAMFDTFHGPVVLEVPPAAEAMLVGTVLDAWQVPVADVGAGGGRFLLRPPTDTTTELAGTPPISMPTFGGYLLLRAVPAVSLELLGRLRLYPLDDRRVPGEPRQIDMAGRPFDALVKFDERFFDELARSVAVEPVPESEHHRLAALGRIGHAASTLLEDAARAAHDLLARRIGEHGERVWRHRHWRRLLDVEMHQAGASVARDVVAFRNYAPAVNATAAWLHAFVDSHGEPLRGDRSYRLRIPAGVSRWIVTAYARSTCAFIPDARAVEIRCDMAGLVIESDGSVEIDLGSHAREGREAMFLATAGRGPWFVTIQLERPLAAGCEPGDLEAVG